MRRLDNRRQSQGIVLRSVADPREIYPRQQRVADHRGVDQMVFIQLVSSVHVRPIDGRFIHVQSTKVTHRKNSMYNIDYRI